MKVGNLIGGLEVVDVKQVNKLNLIQFLKEVDNYLQQGYKLDVQSGRQVGLVLQTDMFKTEQPFGGVDSVEPELETEKVEETSVEETVAEDVSVPEATEQSVEAAVKEEAPVAPKKTTTRSKKTTQ